MSDRCIRVSLLLATYAREDLLDELLQSLVRQELPDIELDVLIGDNACREETRQVCVHYQSRLNLHYQAVPERGKNNALNSLIPNAQGDLFIFSDDDIIADSDWIKHYVDAMIKHPDAMLFGGRVLPNFAHGDHFPDHPLIQKYANAGNWADSEGPIAHHQIHGTNMAVRRRVIEDGARFNASVGPNGKNYMMGSETEFNLQLRYHGYPAVYLPAAIVHHHIRAEQYDIDWWLHRMERRGRGAVMMQATPEMVRFRGAPRYLYKSLCIDWLKMVAAKMLGRSAQYIDYRASYLFTKGLIFQYRVDFSG